MRIELSLDYGGEPFILLDAGYTKSVEEQLLMHFIKNAKKRGIVLQNESSSELSDNYASIRLGKHIEGQVDSSKP